MDWATGGNSGTTSGNPGNSGSFWSMGNPYLLLGATLLSSILNAGTQIYYSEKSMDKQKDAQKAAEAKQREADEKAETARLRALAKNQEDQTGFDFGVDSGLAKRYADAAQKWSAGTGSMTTEDDNENPFYTRGLI